MTDTDLERMVPGLQALITDPGYAIDGEDIARGPDGQPLPDEDVRQQAIDLLTEIRQLQAQDAGTA